MRIGFSGCAALVLVGMVSGAAGGYAFRASRAEPEKPAVPAAVAPVPFVRPAGSLLGIAAGCEEVGYQGPQTLLYSDRPYHTSGAVGPLEGYAFCRSQRHGQEVWLIEVLRPTTFLTLASLQHQLELAGWKHVDLPVRVDAAGLSFDRLYQRSVEPGRYAIHYGHARTANPVFWRPADARMILAPRAGYGE